MRSTKRIRSGPFPWVLLLFLGVPMLFPALDDLSGQVLEDRESTVPLDIMDQQIVFSSSVPDMISTSLDKKGRMDLVWSDSRTGSREIYYLKIGRQGWKLHNDMRITSTSANSINPVVCSTRNDTTIIVWVELHDGTFDLMMSSLLYDGMDMELLLDGIQLKARIDLSSEPVLRTNSDGRGVLFWSEKGEYDYSISMMELDPATGVTLGPVEVLSGLGEVTSLDMEISSEGDLVLVWNGRYGSKDVTDPNYGIYFTRMSANGTVLLPPIRKSITGNQTRPDLQIGKNSAYLVFSSDRYSHSGVIFSSFTLDGVDLVDDLPLTPPEWYCEDPSIQWDPEGNLSLVWWDKGKGWSIYRTALSPEDGSAVDTSSYPLTLSAFRTKGHPDQQVDGDGNLHLVYINPERDGIRLIRHLRPDLAVVDLHPDMSGRTAITGERITFRLRLSNSWPYPLQGIEISSLITLDGEVMFISRMERDLEASSEQDSLFEWTPSVPGLYNVTVMIDPDGRIAEMNESNNIRRLELVVARQSFDVVSRTDNADYIPGEGGESVVHIKNSGTAELHLNISVLGDISGWFGKRWDEAFLDVGSEKDVVFSFDVPEDVLAGDYLVLFEIRSLREREDLTMTHHQIRIRKIYNNNVDFNNYQRDIDPGKIQRLTFSITNNGNSPMFYTIDGTNDAGIPMSVAGSSLPDTLGPIQPSSRMTSSIDLEVPRNLTAGKNIHVEISVEPAEGGQRFSSTYNLTVLELPWVELEVIGGNEQTWCDDWSVLDMMVNLTNTGNAPDLVVLEITDSPPGWISEVVDPISSRVSLEPGENRTVLLHLVPEDVPGKGEHNFLFEASPASRADLHFTQKISIEVGEILDVSVSEKEAVLIPDLGGKQRVLVTFTNDGNMDTSYIVSIKGPGSDSATIEPMGGKRVLLNESGPISLQAKGSMSLWLEFELPEKVDQDTIIVNITCIDDPAIFDEMVIHLQLPKGSDYGSIMMIAGGILAFSLLVILFLATRFLMNRRETRRKDLMDEELDDDI